MRSIEDSRFHIIVFSKTYASSSWCLDELVKIMECQKTTEQTAYPVFYDVEPREVRNQSGAVGEAFEVHVGKLAAGKWREAMKEAAGLAGWELKTTVDGHEARFIQNIVKDISLNPYFINSGVDGKLVGMGTRVNNVVSSLEIDSDDVRMIGIKGMGGSGKTTLARAVFDSISIWFEGKSFVENVREVSKGSLSGLKDLQKLLLCTVLNDPTIVVAGVYDGKFMMRRMMPSRKVLVVLDDVDNIEQLEALAGQPNWYKPGSRIIVTTRDEQVLKAYRVNFIHDVSLLSREEAICLFSKHAFGRVSPNQGYEEISRMVVQYAAGLPLTIKALGSFLCDRPKEEWEDAIRRLKTIPLKETLEKLELSFNGLDNDQKEIFLDIACFLKGEVKKKAITILESCGFRAQIGLRVLEQKSLIIISKDDYDEDRLLLHDHMEEMGWNIVRRLHPHEPKRHSRLWIKDEIEYILLNELGTEETKGIRLMYSSLNLASIMKGLRKMKELRFLYVVAVCSRMAGDEACKYLPDSLQSLYWIVYPFCCLPNTFQANKLVKLDMAFSDITQLWEEGERKILNKLKFLDLRYSKLRTLDLSVTPRLEELNLEGCINFVELQLPVQCSNLKILNLSGSKVNNINLEMIPNLEKLNLTHCYCLQKIHAPVGCLKKLSHSRLDFCPNFVSFTFNKQYEPADLDNVPTLEITAQLAKICLLHPTIKLPRFWFECKYDELGSSWSGNLEKLVSIGPCVCENLEYLSATICGLQNLRELKITGSIPRDLWQLESLEKLCLWFIMIQHLPDSICMMKHLKSLKVESCWPLKQLPKSICRLERLEELHIEDCRSLRDIPNSICVRHK